MAYHIGDLVSFTQDRTAGAGRVVAIDSLFGETYLEVYFPVKGQLLRRAASEFQTWGDPFERLAAAQVAPAAAFVARLITRQFRALLTQQGVLSAANFRLTPLPHQIVAVDSILSQYKPRSLIADEVGLGKTIEAAMVYEELKLRGLARRVLAIVPSGLTYQWQQELQQKFGEEFAIFDRPILQALRQLHGQEANLWQQHDRVITSLDFVKPRTIRPGLSADEQVQRERHNKEVVEAMVSAGWDVVIVDEAHKLSKHADGTETARYRVGKAICERAPVFLALTATPHQGDPARFLYLLNLIDPFAFNTPEDLHPDKVRQIMVRNRRRAVVDTDGQRLFKQRITSFFPVDRSGPDCDIERQLYEEVSRYVAKNYDLALQRNDQGFGFLMILYQRMVTSSSQAIRQSLRHRQARLQALQGLLEMARQEPPEFDEEAALDQSAERLLEMLQSLAGVVDEVGLRQELALIEELLSLADRASMGRQDAKLKALLRIVDEVCRRERDPTTKFLVFTEFIATQEYITQALRACGYKVVCINGKMSVQERVAAREAFRTDAQFLVSTDAGGEGINLQFCHVMINYDLPWNPMRLEQRIGRLDRIGQEHNVAVLNMLVEDTVEDRVRQVLERKLALIREQFGEDRLADVLSALQDEFSFDRFFIDAVRKREAETSELEALAQEVYQRAKAILEKDELLLPQAVSELRDYRDRLLEVPSSRVLGLVRCYLELHGEELHAYARRPGVYYFDLPGGDGGLTAHHANVVFDRTLALEDDSLDFFHINHPTVRAIQERLDSLASGCDLAHLRVLAEQTPEPQAHRGLWAVYSLELTNEQMRRVELLSLFLGRDGTSHPPVARWLTELDPTRFRQGHVPLEGWDWSLLRHQLDELAEKAAHEQFLAQRLALGEQLAREREKVLAYFQAQELSAQRIAIDNIRQARLTDLRQLREQALRDLQRRAQLVPNLKLQMLAAVAIESPGKML